MKTKGVWITGSIVVVLALLLGIFGCAQGTTTTTSQTTTTQAAPIELKIAVWSPPVHKSVTEMYNPWVAAVDQATNGRVKMTVFAGGALASATDTYDAISSGGADIGSFNPGFTPGRFNLSSVAELPFMCPTIETGTKIIQTLYHKYPEFQAEYGNVKILNIFCNVPVYVFTTKTPVRTMEDLKGMRLRVNSPAGGDIITALGATPVFMGMTDLFTAMERGTVDGAIYTIEAVQSFALGPVSNYTTMVPLSTVQSCIGMNINSFNKLPKDAQDLITTGALGEAWLTAHNTQGMKDGEAEGLKILQARGANWQQIFLTPQELARWQAAVAPLLDKWAADRNKEGKPGTAVLNDAKQLLAQLNK